MSVSTGAKRLTSRIYHDNLSRPPAFYSKLETPAPSLKPLSDMTQAAKVKAPDYSKRFWTGQSRDGEFWGTRSLTLPTLVE